MRKPVLFFISFICLFSSSLLVKAGNPPAAKWTVKNPFEQKVFIENKGQYNLPGKASSKEILFGARMDGLEYYFTPAGIWIERYIAVKRTAEELEQLKLPTAAKNLKAFEYKYVPELHQINFIGSDAAVEIIGNSELKSYYNFRIEGNINVKSSAYKKIIYKNLYPGIDMEFYFPDGKQGFEYSFIVHPGGDISQIKMSYPSNESLSITGDKNVAIQSVFGKFIDHAPVANQQGLAAPIACSFKLNKNEIDFTVGNYDKNKDLIIDPWTATPVFPNSISDRAYNVDWDNAGNCYAYGGSGQYSEYPLYMLKYDSNGNLLWQTVIDEGYRYDWGTELYGDFVVDKNSQSIYIAMGVNIDSGGRVIKLNQAGMLIDSSHGNLNMLAIWQIAYSTKYNELVGVGGSYPNYPAATAMYIDTNLITETVVYVNNPPDPYRYMWGVTLDNSGNCYMALSGSTSVGDTAGNDLFKVSMPTLSPTAWEVNDGYKVIGIGDPQYIAHNNGNGFNGITVNSFGLYTYDSYTLKQWNTTNGALIDSAPVTPVTAQYIYWGGLVSDSCGNIFLGCRDTIKQYNSSLTLMSYIKAPDTIYDLNLGKNNILYACGAGFISAIELTPHLVNTNTNTNSDTTLHYKICLGNSAGLKAQGAINYAWSPSYGLSATTGDSVTATPSTTTTYTVICSGSIICPPAANDTFHIVVTVDTFPLPHITVIPTSSTICFGKSISLKASGVITYQWYPPTGLSSSGGDSVIASPTVSTTYTVKGIDSHGCYDIGHSSVAVDTLPQAIASESGFGICKGQPDTLSVNQEFAYSWSPSVGLNDTIGDTVIASPTITTIYTVTVTGNNGCTNTSQSEVYVLTPAVIISPASPSLCPGHGILLTTSGATNYQWSPSASLDSISVDSVIASPTTTTTYTIISSRRSCFDTAQEVITVAFPNVMITPLLPSIYCGQTISLYASGADTFQWSPSAGLNTTIGDTIIADPTVTTTYTIIGGNGCYNTATSVVTVDSLPVSASSAVICDGSSTTLTASGATAYLWTPSTGLSATTGNNILADPTITTTYTIQGFNSIGCSATTTDIVTVIATPNKPTFRQHGDTLISTSQHDNQWYRNDSLLMGDTSQDLIITLLGEYQVRVNNEANGCSVLSDSVKIDSVTGIEQLSIISEQVYVYPNPFNSTINLSINPSAQDIKDWNLQVADVLGRIIYSMNSLNYSNGIDLSKIPSGVYFISVTNGSGRAVFPVIKQE